MHPLDERLRIGAGDLGLQLTQDERRRLLDYLDLIQKWNRVYNLTALRDPQQMLTHHLLDSLAVLLPLRRQAPAAMRLLDVGAGAGLPGVVIAICRPDLAITCVDTVAKKAAFITQAAAALALPGLTALHRRVEDLTGPFDLICSRAFASLPDFVAGSAQALSPGGLWLAMKGKRPDAEIAALPPSVDMFHVEPLAVPGLGESRCLVWMRQK